MVWYIDKRKVYDFAIANLFRKYGIDNDNLYEGLDDIWDSMYKNFWQLRCIE